VVIPVWDTHDRTHREVAAPAAATAAAGLHVRADHAPLTEPRFLQGPASELVAPQDAFEVTAANLDGPD